MTLVPGPAAQDPAAQDPAAQDPEAIPATSAVTALDDVRAIASRLRARVRDNVMGRDEVIELVLVALFADGHVLLEDYPGSGKTTLAKSLGGSILDDLPYDEIPSFRRIQFTPDLLPSDVTGVMVFDTTNSTFQFRRGPVFAYVVLVDEINRTSPKVQAALLEAMAEKQVTVDNVSHPLNPLFFVMATQNPLDAIGTYPLPLAQLDRFLFKLVMKHIDRASELEVLRSWGQPHVEKDLPRVARGDVVAARAFLRREVAVAPAVHECLVDIAQRLRDDKRTRQGVSTRCLVQAIPALQTLAMLRGRDFVSSEDVEYLATPLFAHRLELTPGAHGVERVIEDAVRGPLEALSRATLRGR
jgi:MoxR-like ATPase